MSSKWKRQGKAQFLMLEKYLITSQAWRATSPNERSIYLELKWRYKGTNNGSISASLRDLAAAVHIGKSAVSFALNCLEAKGFIDTVKPSGFNVKIKIASEYRLTEYTCNVTGELPTKRFMKWFPDPPKPKKEKTTVPLEGRPVRREGQSATETQEAAA